MHESTEADRCKAAASAYVDEIMTDSVVSTSHITLGRGYMRFGREQFRRQSMPNWQSEVNHEQRQNPVSGTEHA